MATRATIQLPSNVPPGWLKRFCAGRQCDGDDAERMEWATPDGRFCVAARKLRDPESAVWWFAYQRENARHCWLPIDSDLDKGDRVFFGYRTARPAFAAVIRAIEADRIAGRRQPTLPDGGDAAGPRVDS